MATKAKRIQPVETKQATRQQSRKAAREAKPHRKVRPWSPDRPQYPERDPVGSELQGRVQDIPGNVWMKANKTGLSTTTIRKHMRGEVKFPRMMTMEMIANALGGRIGFIKGRRS